MINQLKTIAKQQFNYLSLVSSRNFSSFTRLFIQPRSQIPKKDYKTNYSNKTYPFLPLNDHPLIPGMPRIIPISKNLVSSIKSLKDQKTPFVLSVLKNKPIQDFFLYKFSNFHLTCLLEQ